MSRRGGSNRELREEDAHSPVARRVGAALLPLACALVWVPGAGAIQLHPRAVTPRVVVGENAATPNGSPAAQKEGARLQEQTPPSISGVPVQGTPVTGHSRQLDGHRPAPLRIPLAALRPVRPALPDRPGSDEPRRCRIHPNGRRRWRHAGGRGYRSRRTGSGGTVHLGPEPARAASSRIRRGTGPERVRR
jgi:hypothetical protein